MRWKYRFPKWVKGEWYVLPTTWSHLNGGEVIRLLQKELRTKARAVVRRVK